MKKRWFRNPTWMEKSCVQPLFVIRIDKQTSDVTPRPGPKKDGKHAKFASRAATNVVIIVITVQASRLGMIKRQINYYIYSYSLLFCDILVKTWLIFDLFYSMKLNYNHYRWGSVSMRRWYFQPPVATFVWCVGRFYLHFFDYCFLI